MYYIVYEGLKIDSNESVYCTLYNIQCIYNVHCTLYSVQCIQCILYLHCTQYIV